MANYDVKETTIQGRRYTLPVMPGLRGRKVLLKLMSVIGPLADVAGKDTENDSTPKKSIGEIIVKILGNLDPQTFDWLLRELVSGGMVAGDGPDTLLDLSLDSTQNLVWCDNEGYLAMLEFIQWALEINFSGFIKGLQAKFKKVKTDSAAASQGTR